MLLIHKKLKKDERDFRFSCNLFALATCTLVSVNLHINITWLVVVVFCRLIQLHIFRAAAAVLNIFALCMCEILKNTARPSCPPGSTLARKEFGKVGVSLSYLTEGANLTRCVDAAGLVGVRVVELVLGQSKLPADHDRAATGQIFEKLWQDRGPAASVLPEGQIQLECGHCRRIGLHRGDPPAVFRLVLKLDVDRAATDAARFLLGQLEHLGRYPGQQVGREQHLGAD